MAASLLSLVVASPCSTSPLHSCNRFPKFSIDHDRCCSPIRIRSIHYSPNLISKALILNRGKVVFSPASPRPPALTASGSWEVQEENQSTELHESKVQEDVRAEVEDDRNKLHSNGSGRLFVGNLPYSITSSQLVEIFGEAGRVVSVEIIYDRITSRSRGFCFVSMGSVEESKEAIRMFDGSQIGGRIVKVNFPEVPRGGEQAITGPKPSNRYMGFMDTPHRIYAGNLSWNLTSEGLRDAFVGQRGLLSARVVYDKNSGQSRGFGFVSFASSEDLKSAMNAMNGREVEGRPLRLNLAAARESRASYPATESKV